MNLTLLMDVSVLPGQAFQQEISLTTAKIEQINNNNTHTNNTTTTTNNNNVVVSRRSTKRSL